MNVKIFASAVISLFATLMFSIFFPKIHLMTFAPFIASLILFLPLKKVIWFSFLGSLVLDFLSAHHFGLVALSYTASAIFFYRYKRLFEDSPLAFALLTSCISLGVSLAQVSLFFLLEEGFYLTWKWVMCDLCLMPFWDGLYALLFFAWPFSFAKAILRSLRRWRRLRN